jgi:HEAT repeat protein
LTQKPLDPDWAESALNQLAEARDKESVPRMKEIALDQEEDEDLRGYAVDALVEMRIPGVQGFLFKVLSTAQPGPNLLVTISSGLLKVGDRRAVPAMKKVIRLCKGEDAVLVKINLEDLQDRLAGKNRYKEPAADE